MTVKQFADSRGVSRQRCYQLIKASGKNISDYTDKKGDLSPEGIELLESLIPDKKPEKVETEQKETSYDRLFNENKMLLETVNNLTISLTEANKRAGELTEALTNEQKLHAQTKIELGERIKRLEAGSGKDDQDQPIPADQPEETKEHDNQEEQKKDPEKREGESAAETSSPVTGSDQVKTDQDNKIPFKKRLKILFTGQK